MNKKIEALNSRIDSLIQQGVSEYERISATKAEKEQRAAELQTRLAEAAKNGNEAEYISIKNEIRAAQDIAEMCGMLLNKETKNKYLKAEAEELEAELNTYILTTGDNGKREVITALEKLVSVLTLYRTDALAAQIAKNKLLQQLKGTTPVPAVFVVDTAELAATAEAVLCMMKTGKPKTYTGSETPCCDIR